MPAKSHTHEPLVFAWNARDHSLWHLVVALLLLMGAMAGFFFIFRIVHPVARPLPATPHHVISLDPSDPAALALIHRAQDRSFALLGDAEPMQSLEAGLLAFHPSFEGYQLKLRDTPPVTTTVREPRLFTPGMDVLPPVARRATGLVASPDAPSTLQAVMSSTLAKRGPAKVPLPGITLTEPTWVQFRVGIGSAGQVVTALPLGSTDDAGVMSQLQAAVSALQFEPSDIKRIEWGEVSFRWEAIKKP